MTIAATIDIESLRGQILTPAVIEKVAKQCGPAGLDGLIMRERDGSTWKYSVSPAHHVTTRRVSGPPRRPAPTKRDGAVTVHVSYGKGHAANHELRTGQRVVAIIGRPIALRCSHAVQWELLRAPEPVAADQPSQLEPDGRLRCGGPGLHVIVGRGDGHLSLGPLEVVALPEVALTLRELGMGRIGSPGPLLVLKSLFNAPPVTGANIIKELEGELPPPVQKYPTDKPRYSAIHLGLTQRLFGVDDPDHVGIGFATYGGR